jgi:ABC-type molybdate transport system substrate-binding protein
MWARLGAYLFGIYLVLMPPIQTTAARAEGSETITVFAAASLTDALQHLGAEYKAVNKDTIRFSFAASHPPTAHLRLSRSTAA